MARAKSASPAPSFASVEKYCLSLPGATRVVQWGDRHVYKIADKVFALAGKADEDGKPYLAFKVTPESFAILTRVRGIGQAPYFAKGQWVTLLDLGALPFADTKAYVARSHAMVAAKLTKKARKEMGLGM